MRSHWKTRRRTTRPGGGHHRGVPRTGDATGIPAALSCADRRARNCRRTTGLSRAPLRSWWFNPGRGRAAYSSVISRFFRKKCTEYEILTSGPGSRTQEPTGMHLAPIVASQEANRGCWPTRAPRIAGVVCCSPLNLPGLRELPPAPAPAVPVHWHTSCSAYRRRFAYAGEPQSRSSLSLSVDRAGFPCSFRLRRQGRHGFH